MSGFGKVYLIGAGPGDPGLLTLRGKEIIEKADVVVYDRLVSPAILGFCNPKAKMVDVGKMPTHHKVKQSEINKLLVQFAGEFPGGVIARLKGGDPFVFGRGGEEALELVAAGVEFEVVPGITSAISVPAYAGIPVSHRGIATSFHIITGHEKADGGVCHPEPKAKDPGQNLSLDFETLAKCPGTLIFLMGIANMDFIAKRLMECGKDPKTPLAFIEKGTTPYQRTVTATLETAGETIIRENVTAPAITIMGGVVELGKSLAWKKNLPLSGKRLVVTRAAKQASGISARLTALGAEVIETPMIETKTLDCPQIVCHPESKTKDPDQNCFADFNSLANFDILAFTSTNGVESFFKQLLASGNDIRILAGKKIASVGKITEKKLLEYGIRCDYVPEDHTGEGLGKLLAALNPIPQSTEGATSSLFDRILLDVPCSNMGVIARRPESKYRITPESVKELAELQSKLLASASQALKVGGILVYATCSPDPMETTQVVNRFVKEHPEFEKVGEPVYPGVEDSRFDGFFAQALRRKG